MKLDIFSEFSIGNIYQSKQTFKKSFCNGLVMGVTSWPWWREGVGEVALVPSRDFRRGSRGTPPQCLNRA